MSNEKSNKTTNINTEKSKQSSEAEKPANGLDEQASENIIQNNNSSTKPKRQRVSIIKLFQFSTFNERLLLIIAFLFSVVTGALQPVSIIIYGRFISDLTAQINLGMGNNSKLLDTILPMIWIILYIGLAAMVTAYISTCLWIRTGESQTRRIRLKYLHSLLNQDMEWYDKMDQQNSLSSRLTSDTQLIQDGISENFGMLVSNISQFIAGFVIAFVKGWKMALVMLSILPILLIVTLFAIIISSKLKFKAQQSYGEAASIVEQTLHSIRTVHSFNLQDQFSKLYKSKLTTVFKLGIRQCICVGLTFALFMFCLYGSFGLALWYGAKLVSRQELDGGTVFTVFLAMTTGSVAVARLINCITSIAQATAGAFHLFGVINRAPVIHNVQSVDNDIDQYPELNGLIEFRNVTFRYPSRPAITVLDNVSLDINPGMTVAVVGASGSGKSTLTHLLQRLYDPEAGEILIDGKNIKQMPVSFLRQHIGHVAQEPILFNMTIRQNLTLGDELVSDSSIIHACKVANCHQFIIRLPNGYNTLLGDSGNSMLSGGQKQRIAIARAILKDPKILILDEATSALDTQSELLVQKALEKASKGRATLVIAHRLSTIVNSDCIIVLENGKIVEKGDHNTLLKRGGIYANMIKNQTFDSEKVTSRSNETYTVEELEYENDLNDRSIAEDSKVTEATFCKEGDSGDLQSISKGVISSIKTVEQSTIASSNSSKEGTWKRIHLEMAPREKKLLVLGAVGASLASCILPLYAYLFSSIVSILTLPYASWPSGSLKGTNLYAFIFFILGVASFIGSGAQYISFAVFEEYFTFHLRNCIFSKLLKQEVSFFQENESGAIKLKLDVDARKISNMVASVWGDLFQLFTTIVSGLILSMLHSWELALVTLSLAPFLVASTAYEVYVQRGIQDKTKLANAHSGQIAAEAIREVKTVVLLNKQSFFNHLYSQATKAPHDLIIKKAYLTSLGSALHRGVMIFANALAFYVGTILLIKGSISFQQMFTSMTVLIATAQAAGRHTMFASTLDRGKSAAISIFDLFDRQPVIDTELEGLEPSTVQGSIQCNQVKFAYPARPNQIILNGNFNLKIKPGQTIALVGASGCGKSTIIGLLQRWYDPLQGGVILDEHDIKNYSVKNLRSHMGLVGQEPILFDFTIAENLGVFDDLGEFDMQQAEAACKASNIHDYIMSLPEKYNTRVGNMGSQLSGGQKQRIAIARALIRNPKILLLDEATSALDSESERHVQDTLDEIIKNGGKTIISISHRLSTVKNADLICVVRDGCIAEQGTHTELLQSNGIYHSMVLQQNIHTSQ